jgi:hypothetical protein
MSRLLAILALCSLGHRASAQVNLAHLDSSIARANRYLNGLDDGQFDSYNLRMLFAHLALIHPQKIRPRSGILDLVPTRQEDVVIRDFYRSIIKKENVVDDDSLKAMLHTLDGIPRMLLWGTNARALPLDSSTLRTFHSYLKKKDDVRGVAHAALAMHWAGFAAKGRWDADLNPLTDRYAEHLSQGVVRHGVVGDDALEGMMGLMCLGRGRSISMQWVAQVMRAQNPDGGWTWELTGPRTSNPHTTLLALWVLAEAGAGALPKDPFARGEREENVVNLWVDELIETTKNTVGFVPPIATRALAYFGLSVYHAAHCTDSVAMARLNRLSFSQRIPFVVMADGGHRDFLVNRVAYRTILHFYPNMTPTDRNRLDMVHKVWDEKLAKGLGMAELKELEDRADRIAADMYDRSLMDGGHEAYLRTFDNNYAAPLCDSCWVRTPPSFFPAILPTWGDNVPMVPTAQRVADDMRPPVFGTEQGSPLYKDAADMYASSMRQDTALENIARYWNDDPGYSGTPSAHIFAIAKQLIERHDLDLRQSCEVYGMVGLALNEVNILCWRLKYRYNYIRPATYIHRYISKDFNACIPTPPFPEYPSGHSCLSGAGITVLQHYFPDEKDFTDQANLARVDIDGSPRTYPTLEAMKREISMSRWYGGIHFKETLDESVTIGERVGAECLRRMGVR